MDVVLFKLRVRVQINSVVKTGPGYAPYPTHWCSPFGVCLVIAKIGFVLCYHLQQGRVQCGEDARISQLRADGLNYFSPLLDLLWMLAG